MTTKIEKAGNIAILCLCVLISSVVVWKFVLPHRYQASSHVPTGQELKLSTVNWASREKTVVLVISTQCRFCTESAPFLRLLIGTAHEKKMLVVAVLPQSHAEATKYLSDQNLKTDVVVSSPLKNVGITAIPTVLIVNSLGVVIDGWVGFVSSNEQTGLLKKL